MLAPLLFHHLDYTVTLARLLEVRHVLSEHPYSMQPAPHQPVIHAVTSPPARTALPQPMSPQARARNREYLNHTPTATKHHPFKPVNVIPWIKYLCRKT